MQLEQAILAGARGWDPPLPDKLRETVAVTGQNSRPGLDHTNLDRLFEAFSSTQPARLGMEIATTRSIIEAHGGRLWATPNDDSGATFRFTLPTSGERPT